MMPMKKTSLEIIPNCTAAGRANAMQYQQPLPERLVSEIKALDFALPIAFDPNTQKPHVPSYAKGACGARIEPQNPLHAELFQVFTPLIEKIQEADSRALSIDETLFVTRLVQGNYLKAHDDLGGRNMPDGTVRRAAYSCLLYLEAIEGGELELAPGTPDAYRIQPDNGQCVCFAAEVRHQVLPVGERPRYAVVLRVCHVEPAM